MERDIDICKDVCAMVCWSTVCGHWSWSRIRHQVDERPVRSLERALCEVTSSSGASCTASTIRGVMLLWCEVRSVHDSLPTLVDGHVHDPLRGLRNFHDVRVA